MQLWAVRRSLVVPCEVLPLTTLQIILGSTVLCVCVFVLDDASSYGGGGWSDHYTYVYIYTHTYIHTCMHAYVSLVRMPMAYALYTLLFMLCVACVLTCVCRLTLPYAMLCYVLLCYAMRYGMLSYVVLSCFAVLCCSIQSMQC